MSTIPTTTTPDPGTLSLTEVKILLYNDHSEPKKEALPQWGNETAEEKELKAKAIHLARERVTNEFHMVPLVAKNVLGAILLQRIIAKLLLRLLPSPHASRTRAMIATTAVIILGILKWGVLKRSNASKFHCKAVGHYPIIGGLFSLTINLPRLHNFLLEAVRSHNFEPAYAEVPLGAFAFLMDVRDREFVLRTHPLSFLKNVPDDAASFEFFFGEVMGRGIFAVDGKEWLDARKVASHLFAGQTLKDMTESTFNEHAERLVELIEEKQGSVFDLQELFQCVVFDAFCSLAFGTDLATTESWMRENRKPAFLVAFDECQIHASKRIAQVPLEWHMRRLFSTFTGLGADAQFKRNLKIIDDYITPIIIERKRDPDVVNKKDLLSIYINYANKTGQSHILEDVNLRDIVVNFMIAGRDTTSCTLTNIFRYLAGNREAKTRTVKEMDHITMLTWDHIKDLPYSSAVINEALRLAPPVGDDFHISTIDCTLPSGMKIEKGTRCFIPNVAIGRDPKLWNNPDSFVPERWLKVDETGHLLPVRRVDEFVHPIFFAGPRLCLGKDMARYESLVMMSKLLRKFDLTPVDVPFSEEYVMGPVIFYKHGLKVIATSL